MTELDYGGLDPRWAQNVSNIHAFSYRKSKVLMVTCERVRNEGLPREAFLKASNDANAALFGVRSIPEEVKQAALNRGLCKQELIARHWKTAELAREALVSLQNWINEQLETRQ